MTSNVISSDSVSNTVLDKIDGINDASKKHSQNYEQESTKSAPLIVRMIYTHEKVEI